MSMAMRRLLISLGVSLLGLVVVLGVVLPWLGSMNHTPGVDAESAVPLPTLWPAPDFTLTDQAGDTVTRDDLKGQVWAADFFFTRCPGICPMLSANMQAMNAQLADHPKRDELRLVSFSLDPEHDTAEVLAEYAEAIDATPGEWLFLTGPQERIWELSEQGFKLGVADTPEDPANPISHTGKIVLVDRSGMIRGFYEGLRPEGMAELQRDLRRLLEE